MFLRLIDGDIINCDSAFIIEGDKEIVIRFTPEISYSIYKAKSIEESKAFKIWLWDKILFRSYKNIGLNIEISDFVYKNGGIK